MNKRLFLLITAVSEYCNPDVPWLPGVLRDAENLRSTLENHCDATIHRVCWLPNSKATKHAILKSLRSITRQAGASDQVLLYFGGHGWRQWGADPSRWNYYFIPYDATFDSAATRGIATDEIGAIMSSLHARELVAIFDCCHSGGMSRFHWTQAILDDSLAGWRGHYVMAASRGLEEAGEDDWGGFFMNALCETLQGTGVTPDGQGRISAQKAWAHAADLANASASRHGHQQVAVSAGINSPIYLTRLADSCADAQQDETIRYYIYVSASKTEMLYGQLGLQETQKKTRKSGFDSMLTGRRHQSEHSLTTTIYEKMHTVVSYLRKRPGIASLDDAAASRETNYFEDTGKWNMALLDYASPGDLATSPSSFCMFKDQGHVLALLVGSPSNLIGHALQQPHHSISPSWTVDSYILNLVKSWERNSIDQPDHGGSLDTRLVSVLTFCGNVCAYFQQTPINVLFRAFYTYRLDDTLFAEVLQYYPDSMFVGQARQLLIGSPVYVALADTNSR